MTKPNNGNPVVDVIYGGQFGSEAKRLFTEYYVDKYKPDAIISNFGPNSGGFVSDGSKWSALPMDFGGIIMLSAGSIINIDHLKDELFQMKCTPTVIIHENASVISPINLKNEEKLVNIGSTMQGTMEAVVSKMGRNPEMENQTAGSCRDEFPLAVKIVNNMDWVITLSECKKILMVIPQGHSLSLNLGMYPYCTSRNTSPQQGLADAGVPIWWVNKIIGIFRTFPIRVSNRYNEEGKMIGFSGPCYHDQKEIKWEDIGVPPEITSVSKKVRRVFTFSMYQFHESVIMNGCTDVFINFMNYIPENHRKEMIRELSKVGPKISFVGYGPKISDIEEI